MAIDGNVKIQKDTTGYYLDANVSSENKFDEGKDIRLTVEEAKIIQEMAGLSNTDDIIGAKMSELMAKVDASLAGEITTTDGTDDKGADQLTALDKLLKKIAKLETEIKGEPAGDKKTALESLLKKMQAQAKTLLSNAQTEGAGDSGSGQKSRFEGLKAKMEQMKILKAADSSGDKKGATIKMTSGGTGGAGQKGGQAGAKGAFAPAGASWSYGGGAGGKAGFPGFNMDAYLNSTYMDQATMDGWDAIGKNQMNQKKMMMLFMYLAKMAMSGDLSAMYRFMQFITWMISKDKASQNVMMASKLIQYENASREALQELLDTPPPDSNNQSESYEFTKIMERTRAQQSSMATSQKLISQMMEEMAQVVEALTGVTKSILDANGAVGKLLNRF